MSSSSGSHQFRYTQTPSKVLHLRNLPWECSEDELVELCKPFGKIIQTKCNVGPNRNQAFVEFADQNQAISMVSYYASSAEPAHIRGKAVYVQYSNRHEIVNSKSPGDTPGNVLLVTMEGVQPGDITIEVIHLVFSAFGYVHKIATFEKAAGFQALIQFSDVDTATAAKETLDGRSIPRYLLPEHVSSCYLKISYSAHTDLNIKFQSHRSRDYTNPSLPVNPTAFDGFVQPAVGPDGVRKEQESNVLLAAIENMQYAVTVDALYAVFSAFGTVQKIAIFEKNGQTQALIQYPDVDTASVAKTSLEGHCIYDGGYCKLHLTYSHHTDLSVKAYSDKSRDYTIPAAGMLASQQQSGFPGLPSSSTPWPNHQIETGYPPNGSAPTAIPPQALVGPVQSWDTAAQAGRQTFIAVPSTFPGQTITSSPAPLYVSAPIRSATGASAPSTQSWVPPPGLSSRPMAPSAASPVSRAPFYR